MMEAADALRRRGYRLTPQRLMVWEVLVERGHVSAEQLHAHLRRRYPGVNISTVYRTLDLLVAEGLAREAPIGGGRRIFEAAVEEDHHHLLCDGCGNVEHIGAQHLGELQEHLAREHGFQATRMVLTSYGRCSGCSSSKGSRARRRNT